MLFFSSDHHFDHDKILDFTERKKTVKTVEEMNAYIIKQHNNLVKPTDTVIFVGDFSFNWKADRVREILSKMHGKKILVMGNHDKTNSLSGLNLGFDLVVTKLEMNIAGSRVIICHYPPTFGYLKFLFHKMIGRWVVPDWHKRPIRKKQVFYIHGHTHSPFFYKDRCFHVGIDATSFKPIPISMIEKMINRFLAKIGN